MQEGNGATSFGAALDPTPPLAYDAEHNVISAIVRWVEEGVAPESFVAAAYNDGSASNGLNYTRPICKVGSLVKLVFEDVADEGPYLTVVVPAHAPVQGEWGHKRSGQLRVCRD